MGLETKFNNIKGQLVKAKLNLSENSLYQYGVDTLSGWAYYTPTYAIQELASGKDLETTAKTRLLGLGVHALAMRPIGLLRNYLAKKWDVTKDSSFWKKVKLNVVTITPVQAVLYGGMLVGGMAWSGDKDVESSLYAWGIGVSLGALHAIPAGFVQDKVRKSFGVKPAIKEKKEEKYSIAK